MLSRFFLQRSAPLRSLQPLLQTRAIALSSIARLPTTSAVPKAATGSGKGGRVDKDAAAAAKLARLEASSVKAALKLKEARKAAGVRVKIAGKPAASTEKAKAKKVAVKAKAKVQAEKKKAKAVKAKATAKLVVKKVQTAHVVKAPKAPQNSWQLFLQNFGNEKRANLKEGEKLPVAAALAIEAAPLYKELEPEALAALQEQFAIEKAAYPAKYFAWLNSLTPETIKAENTIRHRRRKLGLGHGKNLHYPDEPKRPLSAFFMFSGDVRNGSRAPGALDGVTSVIEQSKVFASEWKQLSESERAVYSQDATAKQEAYTIAKKEFDASHATAPAASPVA